MQDEQRPAVRPENTTPASWDERYRGGRRFSQHPNGVLLAEVADLPAGRALDVGAGEGADARWLARRGWEVTAVDFSGVALARAAADAEELEGADVAGRVRWVRQDLTVSPPPAGVFDLVSAQYFPLHRSSGPGPSPALRGLLDAVAPGGTLLVVGHELTELVSRLHDVDPEDYDQPADVARMLDDGWEVLVDETLPRTAPAPPGSHHTHDTVLRARRR
ncbi:class I SAM-dependent methyltransferase [Isoptericola cucumis]|uniref:Methyltransferase domain-containing protein n=1 Tax=Isoptericola cucumis TaxID=1776856 RepID=A0ABQ2B6P2_9MICO|nr:class I SAM-dependent methyltransferase [Isoptericola cucumis]GGI07611.1 hypothetical protein GCM10007368_17030 [Isoptericola cucumis]